MTRRYLIHCRGANRNEANEVVDVILTRNEQGSYDISSAELDRIKAEIATRRSWKGWEITICNMMPVERIVVD